MRLPFVFLFGFLASLAVVGGMIWLFAAYETASLLPLSHEPRLSQDKWFEIVRNAVTTAAALGVGVTLFFSYRRQQTAEKTQLIASEAQLTSAKAQQTAAAALELSNKQHALDQSRRQDTVTAELRSRYVKTVEQLGSDHLAVRMAGIYSLAALADDWAVIGNDDERQVCIDLLGAYFRSAQPGESDSARRELRSATLDAVSTRLNGKTAEKRFWGRCNIALDITGAAPSFDGVVIERPGALRIRGATSCNFASLKDVDVRGGFLGYAATCLEMDGSRFHLTDSVLESGSISIILQERNFDGEKVTTPSPKPAKQKLVRIRNFSLQGGSFSVIAPGWDVIFEECRFEAGSMFVRAASRTVTFSECFFKGNVFEDPQWGPNALPITAQKLLVRDCKYGAGVPELEAFDETTGG
ncbi:hypothetical protein [Pseudarthrobacter oxydans]|uniref:hypothetical protein n=1 Tax=Pseudarthrobacter oxydans TaxID=1671 RepID=UPI002AA80D9F|nr:hypothetical protein [Pseudarthrobacter oxydans]WPU08093.1 hypothetical protein SMD14_13060 [Pseudarthrobacter oxydans]